MVVDMPDVLNIARSAMLTDPETGQRYVFVVNPDRVLAKTIVATGVDAGAMVEIVDGLTEGTEIVGNPDDTMQDGMTLELPEADGTGGGMGGSDYSDSESGQGVPPRGPGGRGPQRGVSVRVR